MFLMKTSGTDVWIDHGIGKRKEATYFYLFIFLSQSINLMTHFLWEFFGIKNV